MQQARTSRHQPPLSSSSSSHRPPPTFPPGGCESRRNPTPPSVLASSSWPPSWRMEMTATEAPLPLLPSSPSCGTPGEEKSTPAPPLFLQNRRYDQRRLTRRRLHHRPPGPRLRQPCRAARRHHLPSAFACRRGLVGAYCIESVHHTVPKWIREPRRAHVGSDTK
ncbi:unnamed protein product [Linum trigynum]|uniref:Uncharacterized protein n=1 Tax=Linum trigynum TaxID=586398 RepID=A0AAV2CYZ2_9ROSI